MFVEAHAQFAFPQCGNAGQEQSHEVHGVFPFDLPAGAEVLLQLLELAHHVAVVGLVNEFGQEHLAVGHQFLREGRGVLDERGVQAFEDVRIGFEGHDEEFLEFPVGFLGVVVLDLLGHAVEGPVEIGGRQVNATAIHVGVIAAQAERLRTDDAAVDDEGLPVLEVRVGSTGVSPHRFIGLEFLEDGEFVAAQHGFRAVVASHLVGVLSIVGGSGDDGDCAGWDEVPAADAIGVVAHHDARA